MANILTIAYSVEGATDKRFLENIIQRTFEEIAFECEGDIDVYPPVYIPYHGEPNDFVENVKNAAITAYKTGIQVLCIHTDADSKNTDNVRANKIDPAFKKVENEKTVLCKNLVPIIPVHMSEAWMLADKALLKEEIGTTKTDMELGLTRAPEIIANPKSIIEEALRIAQDNLPKKSKNIKISALYQPIGQNISLVKLEQLPSYKDFRASVYEAFRRLNYIH